MDYRVGLSQVLHAIYEEYENKIWGKWIAIYPHMNEETFISFDDFLDEHKPQKKLQQSDKDRIDRMVDAINAKVVKK